VSAPGCGGGGGGEGAIPLSLLAVLCEADIFAHSYVIFQSFPKFEI
jgi:hypothetical protein